MEFGHLQISQIDCVQMVEIQEWSTNEGETCKKS